MDELKIIRSRLVPDIASILHFGSMKVTFVAEPDEMISVFNHVPYHQQEVCWVLSNTLTKGQTLSTHMEP